MKNGTFYSATFMHRYWHKNAHYYTQQTKVFSEGGPYFIFFPFASKQLDI